MLEKKKDKSCLALLVPLCGNRGTENAEKRKEF